MTGTAEAHEVARAVHPSGALGEDVVRVPALGTVCMARLALARLTEEGQKRLVDDLHDSSLTGMNLQVA
jgi:hypothetical protein